MSEVFVVILPAYISIIIDCQFLRLQYVDEQSVL